MSTPCIHGFQAGQCAACRPCAHGLTASRCSRCQAEASAPARRTAASARRDATNAPDSEEHEGWEIFYVPEVSGWQLRAPEETVLPDSYRSLFLARKAVEQMIANPPAARPSKRSK